MNTRTNLTPPLRLVTPQTGRNSENNYRHDLAVQNLIRIRDYARERLEFLESIDRTSPMGVIEIMARALVVLGTIADNAEIAARHTAPNAPVPGLDDLGDDDYIGDIGGAA